MCLQQRDTLTSSAYIYAMKTIGKGMSHWLTLIIIL